MSMKICSSHRQLEDIGKKISYFGIDTDERVKKFLFKFTRMVHKHLYGEKLNK